MEAELFASLISESLIVALLVWRMTVQDKRVDKYDKRVYGELADEGGETD